MKRPPRIPASAPMHVRKGLRAAQLKRMSWAVTHLPHQPDVKIVIYQRETNQPGVFQYSFDQRAWDVDATKAYAKAKVVLPATAEQIQAFELIAKQAEARKAESHAELPEICPRCGQPAILAGLARPKATMCSGCAFAEGNNLP